MEDILIFKNLPQDLQYEVLMFHKFHYKFYMNKTIKMAKKLKINSNFNELFFSTVVLRSDKKLNNIKWINNIISHKPYCSIRIKKLGNFVVIITNIIKYKCYYKCISNKQLIIHLISILSQFLYICSNFDHVYMTIFHFIIIFSLVCISFYNCPEIISNIEIFYVKEYEKNNNKWIKNVNSF